MGIRVACCVVTLLLGASSLHAQPRTDPVTLLIGRLQVALGAADGAAFGALFEGVSDEQIRRYRDELFVANAVRTIIRERDRMDLEGAPPGDGHRVIVELFIEQRGRARILTWSLDIRRPPGGDAASWRIVRTEGLTAMQGMFRLRLNTAAQYAATAFEIGADDMTLVLQEGTVFIVDSDDGITGLVLLGRGEMRFTPSAAAERGQLRLFSGSETMAAPFEAAFVRVNPLDFERRVNRTTLRVEPADPRAVRRAQEVFERESPKSFVLDLQDLSDDTWHLLPPGTDFLAEVRTRRFGLLTYTRSSEQAEDISLVQRERQRTIVLYASAAKLAARGRFYSDDLLREYDVLDYSIEAAVSPKSEQVAARARLSIRTRATLSTLMLRLADSLAVSGVSSVEHGRLLHLRLRSQNMIAVNLPQTMPQDSDITLIVTYTGRLPSQEIEAETSQVVPSDLESRSSRTMEPTFLQSNQSYWYPQNPVTDYATAAIRITVPDGFTCLATGEPIAGVQPSARELAMLPGGKTFAFRAGEPLRYLAFVVSRFSRVAERSIVLGREDDPAADRVMLSIEANSMTRGRARASIQPTEDILRFYASLMGDAPYSAATLAVVESELPGGHSPGYLAILKDPQTASPITWRNDPAAFDGFPEFFLAHELAHQWWGQAVGWKNYHEQWLSEGFAQYFAALYGQKSRGDRMFGDMLRQFRRWTLSDSDQGPVHLGYRLGHVTGNSKVFRAVVYNKGAGVLHMLRRLLGDETFFEGLRRFYQDRRFQKAGTEDLQRSLELVSGRNLTRFFERWIYGTTLPVIAHRAVISDGGVDVHFEQKGNDLFDLPVTVTLSYVDGRTMDVVVAVTEKVVQQRIRADGVVRQVQVNRDSAALAEFEALGPR